MSILFNALRDTKIPDNFPKDIKITHSVQSILDQWQRLTTSTSTDSKISRHRSDPKEIELFYLKSFTKVIVDENSTSKSNLTDAQFIQLLKTLSKDSQIAVLCHSTEKARLFSYLAVRTTPLSHSPTLTHPSTHQPIGTIRFHFHCILLGQFPQQRHGDAICGFQHSSTRLRSQLFR
jgi:hypothetical protein